MRTLEHAGAVVIFLVHGTVVLIALFGWLVPAIWPFYMFVLAAVLIQNILYDYCFLSRWEFALRRMLNPQLRYEYNFTSYYTYKLTKHRLSTHFICAAGTAFVAASLAIQFYFLAFFWT